ncbi:MULTISPECIES: hypothetical protein [unclassified Streptomyces]|uniref:hypothetical protein n=1 Tax=unclassified Streptomyces TaxID=2593676 RepID=UPI000DD9DE32|nr:MULTISPECIES: hypothetical protein [unclassified Streptomyces]QZZ30568.1 hypothetical protein A7X85_33920 [Streptomyces sp. ST1015]
MASRASSDLSTPGAPPPIPSLPGLGTTWYGRGASYWLRRLCTAVLFLLVLALLCLAAFSLYRGFRTILPSSARDPWDWAQLLLAVPAAVWGWRVQRRAVARDLANPPTPEESRTRKRSETTRATGLALLGRFVAVLAAPVMPALAALAVGWTAAMLTVREYPSEVGARRWMQEHQPPGAVRHISTTS